MLTVISSNCTVNRQITLNLPLTSAAPGWYQKRTNQQILSVRPIKFGDWKKHWALNHVMLKISLIKTDCACAHTLGQKGNVKKKKEIKNEREAFSGWLLWNVCLAVERNILSARIVFCIRNCASLCNDPCTVWLIDDRLSYIALFSTLLSRLTAFTCGSTWVTSLL